MLNNVMKSLVTMLASFALFVGCGESYVSLDGTDADKAKGGCEHCEHCESGEDLADKEDDSKDSTKEVDAKNTGDCLLYTSPSPRDQRGSRMPSSA